MVPDALRALARLHGVQTGYTDMAGRRQDAFPEALIAVLQTLGVAVARMDDVPAALRETRRALAGRVVDPVRILWRGQRAVIPLRLPGRTVAGPLRCEWRWENGEVRRVDVRLERLKVAGSDPAAGGRSGLRLLPGPARVPTGYHRLVLAWGDCRVETHVFGAPPRCFQRAPASRGWGVFAPAYALHSQRGWGAGDFGDLAGFASWVGAQGGRFVGTLPLLPVFLDAPCDPSPYSPVSRLFWNEFHLDVEGVPELATCPGARRLMASSAFREQVRGMREASRVDYAAQMACKRRVLELLGASLLTRRSSRRRAFERFVAEHPQVADYARFRAVREQRGQPWARWPVRMRAGELRDADCLSSLRHYHLYVQWLAHEQMASLSEHARRAGVDLYLDMPVGVHRDGYDSWRYQALFALDASGGAPPDPVFTRGQDWGFAPMHPRRSREEGHAYIRACVGHHVRHARMLRFDHVMGLHRLYWVPRGLPASQGAYVAYPAEELYAILGIESHRHRAALVGENLGTVPAGVNRSLKRHGVCRMFVAQYEARPALRAALPRIPADVVASLNTHDMPPFAAFWRGLDIEDRRQLGLIRHSDLAAAYRRRRRTCRALAEFLRRRGRLAGGVAGAGAVFRAAVEHLGASAARWVLVNLEDVWLETVSQNTPGTTVERVNWRRKARFSLEALCQHRDALELFAALRRLRGRHPRRPGRRARGL
ncbi:MAG: 4-alpha-glucanotransferase [Verrucomicrobia bacterium]|nr:4-alpha-glucanotransferase [Verrucomicrobiota bacterium]